MTKREARKVSTLIAAANLRTLEHNGVAEEVGYEAVEKVQSESKRLAQKLAGRYGYDARELPATENEITSMVLSGEL